MKKHLLIFLLALLPFMASAQTDHIFELFGYTKFKLGDMTLSYTQADGLLVNGVKATAAQINTISQVLAGNAAPITSGGVYTSLQATITRLNFRMDSLAAVIAKSSKDTTIAKIKNSGITALSIMQNDSVRNYFTSIAQSIAGGTYFAPTAISFGPATSTSLQPILTSVTGATSYALWRNGSNIATLTPPNLTYNDTGLTPNTTYSYSATATDGSKVSMPVTASAATLNNMTYTTVAYLSGNPNNSGSSVDNRTDDSNNPNQTGLRFDIHGASLNYNNNLLTASGSGYISIDLAAPAVAGTYRLTIANTDLTMSIDYAGDILPVKNGNDNVYTFTLHETQPTIYLHNGNSSFSLQSIKLEKQN